MRPTESCPRIVNQPRQEGGIFTNAFQAEWCGISYGSGPPIWITAAEIDQFCY